ncbi:hypothetical protein BX600DRAFT_498248 [Xylariales sp. PMI_506]|nr:hypothetical protein BX600DRAFT_498248 [Xylariales sp. PMI_506]
MSLSPEEKFFEMIQFPDEMNVRECAAVYDSLPPAAADQLVGGSWKGNSLDTGHPTHEQLQSIKWAGKDFHSVNKVYPIMVHGEGGARTWASDYGEARLREVQFHGKVSIAMVYDKLPIIDTFRSVNEDTVMGAMDNKDLKDEGLYYFYLTRI